MSGLLGLVDYHSDEDNSSSSSSPPRNQLPIQPQGQKNEPNQKSEMNAKDSNMVSSLITDRSTQDFKLPSNLVQPKQLCDSSISQEDLVQSNNQASDSQDNSDTPPSDDDSPVNQVFSRANLEEIRVKRNQLLMPEAWPDCPVWELPPEPIGEVDEEIQAKVANYHAALQNQGIQFNERLQANRGFRNPHIYDKLVEFLGLDQLGSNFSKDWYDPNGFPREAYAAKLREAQRIAATNSQPRSNINFVPPNAPNPCEIASSAVKRVMNSIDAASINDDQPSRRRKTKWELPPQ